MFLKLLLLFTIVPLIELSLLIKLGQRIGLLNTILLVVLTGVAGAALARAQGFGIVTRIQNELAQGKLPGESLLDGALVLAGALLLLTPGLITDLLGFSLILPVTRLPLKSHLKTYFRNKVQSGQVYTNYTIED